MRSTIEALVVCLAVMAASLHMAAAPGKADDAGTTVRVTDFFPADFDSSGQTSYQAALQRALDSAGSGQTIVFPPHRYLLNDPAGLRMRSGQTLSMYGAQFVFPENWDQDGQAFFGESVSDVQLFGGEIVGHAGKWADGVNVRGIHLVGPCERIRIRDMRLRDLTSNGIGVFATADAPARDVWVFDSIVQNCCNRYGDYSAPAGELHGPEKGSTRLDQGLVAFYYVNDFCVRGCRFEDARSDGTHFFHCRAGQFAENKVYRAKMGGYFLEGCENVLAAGNIIVDSGSRGVTIERGSRFCTLTGNTISGSGREGLWMPDSTRCLVTGNLFLRNGRKPNGTKPNQIWNANITIDEAAPSRDPKTAWPSGSSGHLIGHNIIETTTDQIAAIRIDATVRTTQIAIQHNHLLGGNHKIMVAGENRGEVHIIGSE